MVSADLFGYVATVLNIVMMIPQVFQAWKTKRTKDLSLMTLVLFSIACLLWVIYGFSKSAVPIIISNTVIGGSNLFLITLKLRYK